MNTKLVLIEGQPGSGKTTTAKLVDEILRENQVPTELYLEGNLDHPADYDAVSFYTIEEFQQLLVDHPEYTNLLHQHSEPIDQGILIPYGKVRNQFDDAFPEELIHNLFQHDIYELPLEQNMNLITNKWQSFAKNAKQGNQTFIFECAFIQNPVTIGMMKYAASNEVVKNYIKKLYEAINDLNPLLIYVNQDNLEASFRKAVKERSKEWSEHFIEYCINQGYGKQIEAQGLTGCIDVLKARKVLEEEIYHELPIQKTIINNSHYEQLHYKKELEEIILYQKHLDRSFVTHMT